MILAVTGSIGTGKTTVARMFARMGAFVIDADEISHQLIYPGRPAWKKIVSVFGKSILNRDYSINRKTLAKKVFSNSKQLKKLCDIIHPLVYKEIRGKIDRIKKAVPSAIIVIDVPLLLESGGEKYTDKVIVVAAPRRVQMARACSKFGLSRSDVALRIKTQIPLKEKIKASDFVIDNAGSLVSTAKQARAIWKKIVTA